MAHPGVPSGHTALSSWMWPCTHAHTHTGRACAGGHRPSQKPQAISCKLSCKLRQLAVAAHVPLLPHAEQPLQALHSAAQRNTGKLATLQAHCEVKLLEQQQSQSRSQQPNKASHLQHCSEARLLVLCRLAKVHGASDVRGTAVVLPPGIQQQQGAGINRLAGARLRPVVNDGAVWAGTCTRMV